VELPKHSLDSAPGPVSSVTRYVRIQVHTKSVLSKMRHLVKPIRWPRPHPRPTKERPFDERVNLGTFQRDRPPSHRRGNPFVPVPFLPKNRASPSQGRRRSGRVHMDGRGSARHALSVQISCAGGCEAKARAQGRADEQRAFNVDLQGRSPTYPCLGPPAQRCPPFANPFLP
jgi:hypothetical protein